MPKSREDKFEWKSKYFMKLLTALDEYDKFFIVGVDNVGSNQMQQIRISLRGSAEVLMGKNTMMRKVLRGRLDQNPTLEKVLPHIVENVGFVFTKEDLPEIRDKLLANQKPAAAKAGAMAPKDVFVEPITTTLGPEKTSFFQALNIPTKITRGCIEILSQTKMCIEGERVGASEATLLAMLNIMPFSYGLAVKMVYDNGSLYHPSILDITDDDIRARFIEGAAIVTMVSLGIGYPTKTSVPHMVTNAFRNLLAIALETDYTFKEAAELKELMSDPTKLLALAAAAVEEAPAVESAAEEEAPAAKDESEEENSSDEDMGFSLFD